jgi:predicted amidohydrolase
LKIACIQSNVAFNDPAANATRAVQHLEDLAAKGVQLAIFPEAYLTGYCVDSPEGAAAIAIPVEAGFDRIIANPPPSLGLLQEACVRLNIHSVVGFAGKDGKGVYNGSTLIEPNGRLSLYKKTHLPDLGLDKFVHGGAELEVFDTVIGKLGLLICYDMRSPEPTRVLALKGAELIVLPTNWPEGAETSADFICVARAAENKVFFATCDRVGEENGFRFIGRSKIIGPSGKVLASAGDQEQVISAEIDLAEARQKRTVNIPGKYELDLFGCRRPELYLELVRNEQGCE